MSVTFNLECSKNGHSASEGSILIRITHQRKMKRLGTGITISLKMWDKTQQKVKKSHPLHAEYNQLLQESLKKFITSYSKLLQEHILVSLMKD